MSYSEYYRERAAEAERNASAAALPLVREQYLKAARSWSQLASHLERVEGFRGGRGLELAAGAPQSSLT